MIRDLKAFYVAILSNEVVCFETNLNLFAEEFTKIVPTARNYAWFYRKFKKENKFSHTFEDKVYYFQKVV